MPDNGGVNVNERREYQYWSALYPQGMDYNGLGQE